MRQQSLVRNNTAYYKIVFDQSFEFDMLFPSLRTLEEREGIRQCQVSRAMRFNKGCDLWSSRTNDGLSYMTGESSLLVESNVAPFAISSLVPTKENLL